MMTRYVTKRSKVKKGTAPGSLIYVGDKRSTAVKAQVVDYDANEYHRAEAHNAGELAQYFQKKTTTWINVDGVHQIDFIQEIGSNYKLHPLLLEDVLNTGHRPKFEEFDNCLFTVMKMLSWNAEKECIEREHVSLICGENFVISFQEEVKGDAFDGVRNRIENSVGRIRSSGSDYLYFALMRAVVDGYFDIVENLGEKIENLQDQILENPNQEILQTVHHCRGEMIFLRKAVRPLREVIRDLERSDSPLIHDETRRYFRDLFDHIMQILDAMETYREMLSGLMELYLSIVSNKMNSQMKVLSLVATIFIPLTFIAGIYGMNFENMPELHSHIGYPAVLGLMVAVAVGMVFFFKKRDWF